MIDIKALQRLNRKDKIAVTEHARLRLLERNIDIQDIMNGIQTGEIIRQYEDDRPFPSCLILGRSVGNKPLHIVASHDDSFIYLITAYYPAPGLWDPDFKSKK